MRYVNSLNSSFIEKYRGKQPNWGPLGYVVYKRTYARLTDSGETEEWWQTVARCCQGILDIGGIFTSEEIQQLYDYVFNLRCCFSGRALWQLGTSNIHRIGADSLQNCWHVAITELHSFCFTFNQLMLGGGVGFNIQPEFVYELPTVKYGVSVVRVDENDVDFIVPDNREGWVELLRKTLRCFFETGKNLKYSTVCIRSKGRPISSFGGTASGSENLVQGISKIVGIMQSRVGRKLRPIDCLDILNIIGDIVVAGNVRRSAELALGSPDDNLFLTAKSWDKFSVPNWRGMSNNSVACNDVRELPETFWENYSGTGEPYGLINLDLCRTYGRLDDVQHSRPDTGVTGTNPCGEVPLEPYEACNLFELFTPNLNSMDELITAAILGYKVCKTISCYPCSDNKVNEVVSRNHRLGIGLTGILQSQWVRKPQKLTTVYRAIEEEDTQYSRLLGTGTSIKLTTVKPSGTLSLLPGVTPGIHPAFAEYYVRRIRFSSNDPIVKMCRESGYPIEPKINEDGSRNLETMIISFPIKTPTGTILAKDVSVIDQLKFQELAQVYWSDNSVSATCYYHKGEIPQIREYLTENYNTSIKSVSFLLHSGHGFTQAPYEEITKEQYAEMESAIKSIYSIVDSEERNLQENLECSSGFCPVR
jgi:hypothetical protein